jgi:16S rRNA (cytosine967-C5)-methyltransferase
VASPKRAKAGRAKERRLPQGFGSRALATRLIRDVLVHGYALDDAIQRATTQDPHRTLEPRDLAFARLVATTALRRHGEIEAVLGAFIERPLPEDRGNLLPILHAAAAQLLFLDSPAHAVINVAVEQCRRDRKAERFDKLANAVLRAVADRGASVLETAGGVRRNIPDWLWSRWTAAYGDRVAERIARASLEEAALDLTVKGDGDKWTGDGDTWGIRLGGRVLPTGSIRLVAKGRIDALPGYHEGAWWPQDAAAALPARLLGDVRGKRIADLCAAPGGKSAQLVAAGAEVWSVDVSAERLERLTANFARLKLQGHAVAADAAVWAPGFELDGVLLDVPCLATGTIRRHPDLLLLKRPSDLARLVELQARLLAHAMGLVKPGGRLVYACCSLEPEEGIAQVERALQRDDRFARVPILPAEIGADPDWITPAGDLRTFPFHMPAAKPLQSGMDGFYAARLERRG